MPEHCIATNCTAPATHVLLTHTYSWAREAIPADQAPEVVANREVRKERNPEPIVHATPSAYLCEKHAKEKSRGK